MSATPTSPALSSRMAKSKSKPKAEETTKPSATKANATQQKGEAKSTSLSAVEALTQVREEEKSSRHRSLRSQIESSFLQRPHPFIGIYFLCLGIVVLLFFATTAVERIELPLEDTLQQLRTKCFSIEDRYFQLPASRAAANEARERKTNGSMLEDASAVKFMNDVIRDFGDVGSSSGLKDEQSSVSIIDSIISAIQNGGDSNAINIQKYAAAATSNDGKQAVRATLPFPLARHHRISFNVLLLSDEHRNAHMEGLTSDFQLPQDNLPTASSKVDIDATVTKSAEYASEQRLVRRGHLVRSASQITNDINATMTKVNQRLANSATETVTFHTEVATILETAMQAALLDNDANVVRSSADALRNDYDDIVARNRPGEYDTGLQKEADKAEQLYRAKQQRNERQFISRHYDSKNKTIDPSLRAAARVALTYDLPDRYRLPVPPADGYPVLSTQITFLVQQQQAERPSSNGKQQGGNKALGTGAEIAVASETTVSCTLAGGDQNSHFVCLVTIPSMKKEKSSTSNADYANAVGTIVASRLGVANFKPATIDNWKQLRAVQSCARSFAYLKRVVDLLDEHPRAAFPEELRPLWVTFLENSELDVDVSSPTLAKGKSPSDVSKMELAAASLHQLLFHPSLIPEQTFPLEQLLVMYMPLLLPFVGALLQSVMTLAKYLKSERKKDRDAVLADEGLLPSPTTESEREKVKERG